MRLKKSQLAYALGRNATRSEVGNASGVELEADIGDVHLVGEHRQANGANFFYRRVHDREHNIDVVDHQVEDNVDVERARGEDTEPVDFEEHRVGDEREHGADSRVESLEMADLNDAMCTGGDTREFIGFDEVLCEGLLDENVDTTIHQLLCDFEVCDCGYSGGRGLDLSPLHNLFDGGVRFGTELVCDGGGAFLVGVDDGGEFNVETRDGILLKIGVDASMIASERADADDGD